MHRKIITLLVLILLTRIGYSQSDKINIKTDKLTESDYLKIDDFYLTHYLYIDLFLRENLFPEANPEDVSSILKAVKKYVSVENNLDIEIEKPGKSNYLIRFAILKKEDGAELLIAFTNWSTKEKIFEKEIKMENDSYTRWYFLKGNKMTYRKDMSSEHDYSNMTKSDLVNAYLFDELSENDIKIKDSLEKILNESDLNVADNIMANLILLKYQIFQRNNDNVIKLTEFLNNLFENNKSEPNIRRLKMEFEATKFQIELMK